MKVLAVQPRSAALRLSLTELVIINNALNEIANGRGAPARIGASIEEADRLLDSFGLVLDESRALRVARPAGV